MFHMPERVPTLLSRALESQRIRKGRLDQASAAKQIEGVKIDQAKWSRFEAGQLPSPAEMRALAPWLELPVAAVILLAYDVDPEPFGLADADTMTSRMNRIEQALSKAGLLGGDQSAN